MPLDSTIKLEDVATLPGLFRERVRRSPASPAYHYFDQTTAAWRTLTWQVVNEYVTRWQAALARESLQPGDRVAMLLNNCPEWVILDQAALGLGLVVVPLYVNDRPDNSAYVLRDAGAKLLVLRDYTVWKRIREDGAPLAQLSRVVVLDGQAGEYADPRVRAAARWLEPTVTAPTLHAGAADELATIVYTSGTTGAPKGVMLSHRNILWNADATLRRFRAGPRDQFLSFLPLSHTFERSIGYYLPMMAGASVAFARSAQQLSEDLLSVRPTVMLTVPRVFQKVYDRLQAQLMHKPLLRRVFELTIAIGWRHFQYTQRRASWRPALLLWPLLNRLVAAKVRAKLGWDRLWILCCGAAALEPRLARIFIGLGLPVTQGYGLTEASPVVSANALGDNEPMSVGSPLSDVSIRIGAGQELLVRSPGVMAGYWNAPEASALTVDADGWLHTGDQAHMADGHLYIVGRLKEIIVLANGEKVAPDGLEAAIALDPLFDQVFVVGEGAPHLSAAIVVNPEQWRQLAAALTLDANAPQDLNSPRVHAEALKRIENQIAGFPGYVRIKQVHLTLEPWTADNGLVTPTLKLRRKPLLLRYGRYFETAGQRDAPHIETGPGLRLTS